MPSGKRKALRRILVAGMLVTAAPGPAWAQAVEELSSEQRSVVDAGRQLFLTWEVSGSPWPRTCVFQFIDATPEEAAAVFTDFERHAAYIPDLRKARISRVIDPVVTEVDYTLRVPIVSDEDYTVRNTLTSYAGGTSYRIAWTLVRATSTRATEGSVRFEPYHIEGPRLDGTLMAYCNLVTPGSRLAKLRVIRSKALAQVRESAHAIADEVERARTGDRALLATRLLALRAALGRRGEQLR